jgi:hypothetical protein
MTTRTAIVNHCLPCKALCMQSHTFFSFHFEFYCPPTFICVHWHHEQNYDFDLTIYIDNFNLFDMSTKVLTSFSTPENRGQGRMLWCVVSSRDIGKYKLTVKHWEVHHWILGQDDNLWVSKAKKPKCFLEKHSVCQVLERADTTKQFQWENSRSVTQC